MNYKKALLIASIALAGGSIPPFAKLALGAVEPFTLVFFRFAAATAVIYYFLPKKELSFGALKRLKWIAIIGAGNPVFLFLALKYLPSNIVPILYSTVPGLGVVYLLLFRKTRPSNIQLAGFLMGLVGVITISLDSVSNATNGNTLLGLGLASVAVMSFFLYGIFSKEAQRNNEEISGVSLAFYFSLVTTLVAAPIALYETINTPWFSQPELKHWLAILYLGFIGTGAQYLLFQRALKSMEAAYVNLFVYLQPVFGVTLSAIVVGEAITLQLVIGGAVALLGARLALSSPGAKWRRVLAMMRLHE